MMDEWSKLILCAFRYNDAVWVATAYLISYTALQPLCEYLDGVLG